MPLYTAWLPEMAQSYRILPCYTPYYHNTCVVQIKFWESLRPPYGRALIHSRKLIDLWLGLVHSRVYAETITGAPHPTVLCGSEWSDATRTQGSWSQPTKANTRILRRDFLARVLILAPAGTSEQRGPDLEEAHSRTPQDWALAAGASRPCRTSFRPSPRCTECERFDRYKPWRSIRSASYHPGRASNGTAFCTS